VCEGLTERRNLLGPFNGPRLLFSNFFGVSIMHIYGAFLTAFCSHNNSFCTPLIGRRTQTHFGLQPLASGNESSISDGYRNRAGRSSCRYVQIRQSASHSLQNRTCGNTELKHELIRSSDIFLNLASHIICNCRIREFLFEIY